MSRDPVFFDFDGVVADSLPAMRAVYAAFLKEHGARPSRAEFDDLNGPALPEIVARLKAAHALVPDAATLLARYKALRLAAYGGRVKPFADVTSVLERLRETGHKCYLVTASERDPVTAFLERWDLGPNFQDVICGEDVVQGKPAPDLYQLSLDRSGADVLTSLAMEDSPNGVRSAVTAGLRTIGVHADSRQRKVLLGAGAWKVVASLKQALEAL